MLMQCLSRTTFSVSCHIYIKHSLNTQLSPVILLRTPYVLRTAHTIDIRVGPLRLLLVCRCTPYSVHRSSQIEKFSKLNQNQNQN